MTIQEYINQSARFENTLDEMRQRLAENAELAHAGFGVADEFLEWMDSIMIYEESPRIEDDRIKVIKEAGDMLWYIASICRKYNLTVDHQVDIDTSVNPLVYPQQILSIVKKYLFYGKEINLEKLQANINCMVTTIMIAMKDITNATFEEIMNRNIEKLSARYGETYTNEAAINKNETNE